ncbi:MULTISPECIES: MgtC/SapB family protein [Deinococcus]|jgi:putative Mg2+ transporter-C (MgtC) family protein|uniref:Magnesium transporter n=2 Tax=Deinococcus soli (ex Cha et al. 2016) TaxID=1309411 RepID=A0A0F7JJ79_9DEIO|nr:MULTISPECIES: MgtC/SapB family protein [Deinococcus]AKH16116.1 magnesium transporter [Deinococcus soli (ex Cha et al. 2016)]MDK2011723.1 MgtC/SapB family protein [Deinococcus sp. 43]MDR6216506.1 putative Mg2+ transporter-C (MgtC) family protein [Deinococcus soli (ex Cha et al. 2016)]MDR6327327.1 putative Mg2+ transporter-C (MgtC) family protein [Deinococcus soli (ex Cha et al. 2016)]MDR6749602.1 putative Mg2+ transporter-C (MgtC) family protein [Deinococcus soli (ex Cha et al. 2016)]
MEWIDPLAQLRLLTGLGVAALLTGLIGWEREAHRAGAGLRTHMLVGISSALFVVLAEQLIRQFGSDNPAVRFDLVGVLAAVVSGVSFLGAGTIFSSRSGNETRGLTTAASLLASAGVGVGCGLHLYVFSLGATLLFLFILGPLHRLETGHRDGET